MLQQDYLMRMILAFFEALTKSWEKKDQEKDPLAAADMLEEAITNATDIDGEALLSLDPESMASVLSVSGIDPAVTRYIAHSMLLESVYLAEANDQDLSQLRAAQARALAAAYGFDLPDDPADFDSLRAAVREDTGEDPDPDAVTAEDLAALGLDVPLN